MDEDIRSFQTTACNVTFRGWNVPLTELPEVEIADSMEEHSRVWVRWFGLTMVLSVEQARALHSALLRAEATVK